MTSCGNRKKRIVFYFSATGNSLYVARQLSDDLLSIPQEMKKDDLTYEADEIGLVCPIYRCAPPEMVKRFLGRAKLKADYP